MFERLEEDIQKHLDADNDRHDSCADVYSGKTWIVVDPGGSPVSNSAFGWRPAAIDRAVHLVLDPPPMICGPYDPPEHPFYNGNSSEWRELYRKGYRCIAWDAAANQPWEGKQ